MTYVGLLSLIDTNEFVLRERVYGDDVKALVDDAND